MTSQFAKCNFCNYGRYAALKDGVLFHKVCNICNGTGKILKQEIVNTEQPYKQFLLILVITITAGLYFTFRAAPGLINNAIDERARAYAQLDRSIPNPTHILEAKLQERP